MKLWEALLKQMEKSGAKVSDVAKGTGLPYTTIDSIIKKQLTSTSITNAFKIAAFFGLSLEAFIGESQRSDASADNGNSQRYTAIQELVNAAKSMTDDEASRLLDVAKAMLPHRFAARDGGANHEEK